MAESFLAKDTVRLCLVVKKKPRISGQKSKHRVGLRCLTDHATPKRLMAKCFLIVYTNHWRKIFNQAACQGLLSVRIGSAIKIR